MKIDCKIGAIFSLVLASSAIGRSIIWNHEDSFLSGKPGLVNYDSSRYRCIYIYVMCVCELCSSNCIHPYLRYITLHCVALHCIALHYITINTLHYILTCRCVPIWQKRGWFKPRSAHVLERCGNPGR